MKIRFQLTAFLLVVFPIMAESLTNNHLDLQKQCEELSKNNQYGYQYKIIEGELTSTRTHVSPPPSSSKTAAQELQLKNSQNTKRVFFEFSIDTPFPSKLKVVVGKWYAACATENKENDLYGADLDTLVEINIQ